MSKVLDSPAYAILQYCQSDYAQAVDAAMALESALWTVGIEAGRKAVLPEAEPEKSWLIDLAAVRRQLAVPQTASNSVDDPLAAMMLAAVSIRQGLFSRSVWIDKRLLQPLTLVNTALRGLRPEYESRYFAMRSLQKKYQCVLSDRTAHLFYLLCDETNRFLQQQWSLHVATNCIDYPNELFPALVSKLSQDVYGKIDPPRFAGLFCDCCRAAGYLKPHRDQGFVNAQTTEWDAAYLLALLFGLPTSVQGLDELFNGGLILAEDFGFATTSLLPDAPSIRLPDKPSSEEATPSPRAKRMSSPDVSSGFPSTMDRLLGRTVLITGRFGTGKTLLSLQLAVEVARKGGVALVIPLEQTVQECLYALESMNIPIDYDIMDVAKNFVEAVQLLQHPNKGRGALIIGTTIKNDFDNFLKAFESNAKLMSKYPLRLIIADPINSVSRENTLNSTALRTATMTMIDKVKRIGINILIVAEESSERNRADSRDQGETDLSFERNIADTVIRLSISPRHNYAQRYFEIQKSRFQREQRGEHPYSITPGGGINIYPSSAAVNNRVRVQDILPPEYRIPFGVPGLNEVLGENALFAGDIIVVQGPEGSLRTPLGLKFLLGSGSVSLPSSPQNRTPVGLIVAARDNVEAIRHLLVKIAPDENKDTLFNRVRICSLPQGHINPSVIFQFIENEFKKASQAGQVIERVMIDDVSNWELSCPFVRDDEAFSNTLVHFLRRQRVTSLMVCSGVADGTRSVVQGPIIQQADCLLQCEQREYRGQRRVMLQIVKTRGMTHRRELFELTYNNSGVEVKPDASLLRVNRKGELHPINIHLFLYSETYMQRDYNQRFLNTIRAVYSRHAEIDSQDRFYIGRAMDLGHASVVDELQVVQIDEFQLPQPMQGDEQTAPLYIFPEALWDAEWKDIHQKLRARIQTRDQSGFFAVPYYNNLALLAYDAEQFEPEEGADNWEAIEAQCDEWEKKHPNENHLFFDFGWGNPENYNCLFFEMLAAKVDPPSEGNKYDLLKWLEEEALVIPVCKRFRRLCQRAHLKRQGYDLIMYDAKQTGEALRVDLNAVVWRQWYSSLNQMSFDLAKQRIKTPSAILKSSSLVNAPGRTLGLRQQEVRSRVLGGAQVGKKRDIRFSLLPGNKSVAGEWYLGVPAYSAAPHVGLEVIKLLTSNEAELDRQRMGIGLPTRNTMGIQHPLYANLVTNGIQMSPYLSEPLSSAAQTFNNMLRRSDFVGYSKYTKYLTYSLRRIIEIPDKVNGKLDSEIKFILADLKEKIRSVM